MLFAVLPFLLAAAAAAAGVQLDNRAHPAAPGLVVPLSDMPSSPSSPPYASTQEDIDLLRINVFPPLPSARASGSLLLTVNRTAALALARGAAPEAVFPEEELREEEGEEDEEEEEDGKDVLAENELLAVGVLVKRLNGMDGWNRTTSLAWTSVDDDHAAQWRAGDADNVTETTFLYGDFPKVIALDDLALVAVGVPSDRVDPNGQPYKDENGNEYETGGSGEDGTMESIMTADMNQAGSAVSVWAEAGGKPFGLAAPMKLSFPVGCSSAGWLNRSLALVMESPLRELDKPHLSIKAPWFPHWFFQYKNIREIGLDLPGCPVKSERSEYVEEDGACYVRFDICPVYGKPGNTYHLFKTTQVPFSTDLGIFPAEIAGLYVRVLVVVLWICIILCLCLCPAAAFVVLRRRRLEEVRREHEAASPGDRAMDIEMAMFGRPDHPGRTRANRSTPEFTVATISRRKSQLPAPARREDDESDDYTYGSSSSSSDTDEAAAEADTNALIAAAAPEGVVVVVHNEQRQEPPAEPRPQEPQGGGLFETQ